MIKWWKPDAWIVALIFGSIEFAIAILWALHGNIFNTVICAIGGGIMLWVSYILFKFNKTGEPR